MLAYNELKHDREDDFNIRFELIRSQYDVFKKYFANIENIIISVTAEIILKMDISDLQKLETALDDFSKKVIIFEKDLKTPEELQARLEYLWKNDRVKKYQIKNDLSIIARGFNKLQFFLNRIRTMKNAIAEARAIAYKSPIEKPLAVVVQRKSSIAETDCPLVLLKKEESLNMLEEKEEEAKEAEKEAARLKRISDNKAKIDAAFSDIQAKKDKERDDKAILDIVKQDLFKEIDKYIDSTMCINFYGRKRARQLIKLIDDCKTLRKLKEVLKDFLLNGKTESDSHFYNRFFSPTLKSSLDGDSLQGRIAALYDCLCTIKDVKKHKKYYDNFKDQNRHRSFEIRSLHELSNKITLKFNTFSKSR